MYTDNNPLTYVQSTAKLNATGHQWVAELADFNFDIKYHPGKRYQVADTLSRMPLDMEQYIQSCSLEASKEEVSSLTAVVTAQQGTDNVRIAVLTHNVDRIDLNQIKGGKTTKGTEISVEQLREAQRHDPNILGFM